MSDEYKDIKYDKDIVDTEEEEMDDTNDRQKNGLLLGLVVTVALLIVVVILVIVGASMFGFINPEKFGIGKPQPTTLPFEQSGTDDFLQYVTGANNNGNTGGMDVASGVVYSPTPIPTNTPTVTPTPTPSFEKGKHSENLFDWALVHSAEGGIGYNRPDKATIERVVASDQEYLVVRVGKYTISYLNDYDTEVDPNKYQVVVSNGAMNSTFFWPFELSPENLEGLIPKIYDYAGVGAGREQLVFAFTSAENDEVENTLHVVSGQDLLEYYCVNPKSQYEKVIKEVNYIDATRCLIAEIKANDRNYYVELPKVENPEKYYTIDALSELRYTVSKKKISLSSYVTIKGADSDEVLGLGEIRTPVVYNKYDLFIAENPTFYLYCNDNYTDKDSIGISKPFADYNQDSHIWTPVVSDASQKLLALAPFNVALTDKNPDFYEKDEKGIMHYVDGLDTKTYLGVDVSHWNTINFKKAKDAGLDFAMIRLGYRGTGEDGVVKLDNVYKENIEEALDCGLNVGVYFFSQAITVEEAIEEADFCITNLKKYKITYPVAFDTEAADNARANDLSNAERTAIAKAFCNRISEAGYTPMIYAGTNWSILNLNLEDLKDIDIWYAYYSDDIYYPYDYKIWQYTDKGQFAGISGNVDLNISFKDYSKK